MYSTAPCTTPTPWLARLCAPVRERDRAPAYSIYKCMYVCPSRCVGLPVRVGTPPVVNAVQVMVRCLPGVGFAWYGVLWLVMLSQDAGMARCGVLPCGVLPCGVEVVWCGGWCDMGCGVGCCGVLEMVLV